VALKEYGVYWLEEPFHRGDYESMQKLKEEKGMALAGGEMTREPYEFDLLLEKNCLDVFQPDVVLTCGFSALKKIVDHVKQKNKIFTPHTWGNGFGLIANAHLAAYAESPFLEYPFDPPQFSVEKRDQGLLEPIFVNAHGCLELKEGDCGLGIHLHKETLKKTCKSSLILKN